MLSLSLEERSKAVDVQRSEILFSGSLKNILQSGAFCYAKVETSLDANGFNVILSGCEMYRAFFHIVSLMRKTEPFCSDQVLQALFKQLKHAPPLFLTRCIYQLSEYFFLLQTQRQYYTYQQKDKINTLSLKCAPSDIKQTMNQMFSSENLKNRKRSPHNPQQNLKSIEVRGKQHV